MQSRSAVKRSGPLLSILLLNFILSSASALTCRSDEGPSDADLKRVARNCMQKIGENSYSSNQQSNWSSGSFHYYGQQTPNQQQQQQKEQQQQHDHWNDGGQNSRGRNYFTGYDEQNDGDENFYGDVRERNNSNNNNDRDYSGDILSQRNRERMQTQPHSGRSSNNERNSKRDSNGTGGSQRSSSSSGSGSNGNNNNHNNKNNNHYNNINKNNNRNNNNENNNGKSLDASCIVHCFFDEMNMLNEEGFPDRYKVTYELTKDLRDRELRSFYIETIQECFRYLESQRRRSDTCQFSRELIRCMTEYARANCDDWDNYHVMFN